MALQKINWTQIDTLVIPTGSTIQLGSPTDEFIDVYVEDIHISGVSFFDYLGQLGYTGVTPTDLAVVNNSGLEIISGKTLTTTYNTTLDLTLETVEDVGGFPAGTTVAAISGKTFVEFVDELLFPVALPTYTIPTITMTGISSGTREIGSTISASLSVYGNKNDANPFTQLRVLRNGSLLSGYTSLTQLSITNIPSQFGFADPNNPNYRYTISPTPYSETHIIPYNTYPETVTYRGDGNYGAGLPKQDNKGTYDTRTPLVRSANAPMAAENNFNSSTYTITGIFPYFYGTSSTLPTTLSIKSAIETGTEYVDYFKILSPASGTLSIPYNVGLPGKFIWFAYFDHVLYPTKTRWYVTELDQSDIDGSFITTAVTQAVNSPNGYWTGINFKMHWSVYLTVQDTIQFRNS